MGGGGGKVILIRGDRVFFFFFGKILPTKIFCFCMVIVACAFNILLVFSLSCLCSHSHSHLTLSLSLLSSHLTPPFPHLLSLSPLPSVKPCLHCRRSSNPHSYLSPFFSASLPFRQFSLSASGF